MQRKEELLAKRAKLAELKRQREEREQRQKELIKRESGTGTPDVNILCVSLAWPKRLF
jgi:phosphoribosyl-dephospho-CoA transferase